MDHIHTILVPTDFSDCSRYAFRLAGVLARESKARLIVLHVKPTLGPRVAHGDMLEGFQPVQSDRKLREVLDHFRLPEAGIAIEHRLACGDAVDEILRAAREMGADLIVMGTHGWKGLTRLVVGSVAEKVLRDAPCPVVTVKTRVKHAETRRSAESQTASPR